MILPPDILRRVLELEDIPTLPVVMNRILEIVSDDSASSPDLAQVLECDFAVSAQVLRMANSAFYGASAEIDSIGVQVKDLETGLLDFPCRVDDQVVLLCWRMGETAIEHWHTVDSGFQGRQPVDERFRRKSTSGGSSESGSRPN